MTESELLDALAKAIDSPRAKGRLKRIREAFAEYTQYKTKRKWWVELSHWIFAKVILILLAICVFWGED